MEQFIIRGGSPLVGEVTIGGAKNAALPILAAATMTNDIVEIENVPDVKDTRALIEAIESIGVRVQRTEDSVVRIDASHVKNHPIENESIKRIRASYYLIGAMLGKYKDINVVLPSGCDIGLRPIDQHIKGFEALGAEVDTAHGFINAKAERLLGAHIYLDVVSVGATINIMMAACLAEGKTTIENAAKEPHVVDLANFLNSMGANVRGAGTDVIRIRGVQKLHGTRYAIIPDQIEAGTFMVAAAATHGDVTLRGVIPKHLESISAKLAEMGCRIHESDDMLRIVAARRLNATHVKTLPYPGFPTDLQPQITTALSTAGGTSIVSESIFENRFKYVDELTKMGARIKVESSTAIVTGREYLTGAQINAPDLRAGAALVIAGLMAEGFTTIRGIHFVERGYENLPAKLTALGAKIEKTDSERELQKFKLKYA